MSATVANIKTAHAQNLAFSVKVVLKAVQIASLLVVALRPLWGTSDQI